MLSRVKAAGLHVRLLKLMPQDDALQVPPPLPPFGCFYTSLWVLMPLSSSSPPPLLLLLALQEGPDERVLTTTMAGGYLVALLAVGAPKGDARLRREAESEWSSSSTRGAPLEPRAAWLRALKSPFPCCPKGRSSQPHVRLAHCSRHPGARRSGSR